jgi:hypothetical protein
MNVTLATSMTAGGPPGGRWTIREHALRGMLASYLAIARRPGSIRWTYGSTEDPAEQPGLGLRKPALADAVPEPARRLVRRPSRAGRASRLQETAQRGAREHWPAASLDLAVRGALTPTRLKCKLIEP